MLERIPLAYYALAGLINFIASFILAVFVLYKSPKLRVNRIFFVFASVASCWGLFHFLWLRTVDNASLANFYLRTVMLFVIFVPATFTHFILAFLKIDNNKKINAANYLISTILAFTVYTPLFAKDMGAFLVFPFWLKPGPVFHFHLIHFLGNIIYAHILMLRSLKRTSGILRNQILYVFIGTGIGYTAGVLNYCPWYRIPIPPFLNPLVSIYVAFASYAIIKYRLLDINVALTRAGVFIAIYPLILGVPFWIGFKYLGKGPWIFPMSIMAVFATAGPFIYIFLQKLAEEALLKEQRRYQETLDNLSESLIEIRDIDKLFPTISSTVGEAIKIKFALIYLRQEEYNSFQLKSCYPQEVKSQFPELIPLDDPLISILKQQKKPLLSEEIGDHDKLKLDSGAVIPLFGKSGFLGFIILGAKRNNKMYTNDDLRVLKSLSLRTASTIENCIFWKEIEDRHRKKRLQEMDSFAYSFAHEIHNPLTFVRNLARVLKERFAKYITDLQDRKEFIEMCDVIFEGADRVMTIVEAIRKFGAKTTGEFETLKLQEVIDGFFTLFGPELKTNFVSYTKDVPPEPIYVKGVAAELQQVLMIFGKNSIYAMKNCQEKKLSLKVTKLNHSTVRVAVIDNGEGIKKEIMDLVFRALFTTKASSEGTGMGLSNAKNFISRHNGRISAESEGEGKGSTLIFELPIVQEVKPDDSQKKGKTDWAF